MTFPASPLPVRVELAFEPDVWTDVNVAPDVDNERLFAQPIAINRGRSDESSMPSSSISATLDNPDGALTPYHPASPYYPNVRRGVPSRFRVLWDGVWHDRFVGSVAEIIPSWPHGDLESEYSPGESYVDITAAGVLRRLGQSEVPEVSPLEDALRRGGARHVWPLSEGGSAVDLIEAATMTRTGIQPSSDDTLPGSGVPVAQVTGEPDVLIPSDPPILVSGAKHVAWQGSTLASAVGDGAWWVGWLMKLPDEPETATNRRPLVSISTTTRTFASWSFSVDFLSSGSNRLMRLIDNQSAVIGTQSIAGIRGRWVACELVAEDGTTGVDVSMSATPIDDPDTVVSISGNTPNLVGAGGVDRVVTISIAAREDDYASAGWLAIAAEPVADYIESAVAWAGERAAERMLRLAAAENVDLDVEGDPAVSETLGPQSTAKLVDALGGAATSDWGMLDEAHDGFGFRYRTRTERYIRQDPVLILDAKLNGITPPLAPIEDDQRYHNQVTATNGTASAVARADEALIDREGLYASSRSSNVPATRLPAHATWGLRLGQWPQMRYPSVTIDLSARPELIPAWLAVRTGDVVRLQGLPSQHPPGHVDLIVEGWSENIEAHRWIVVLNCSPAAPWQVGRIADPDPVPPIVGYKVAPDSCVLRRDEPEVGPWVWDGNVWMWDGEPWIWEDVTAIHVRTMSLPWTEDPAELPWDILVDGERMTVTGVEVDPTGDDDHDQILTVIRGVGGFTHGTFDAGTPVLLADPAILAF